MKKITVKLIPIILSVLLALSWTLVSYAAVQLNTEPIVIYEEGSSQGLMVVSSKPVSPNPDNRHFYKVELMLPGDSFTKDFDVENRGSEAHDLWFWTGDGHSYDNPQDKANKIDSETLKLLDQIDLDIYVDYQDGKGQQLFYSGKMNGNGTPNTNKDENGAFKILSMAPGKKASIHTVVHLDGESIGNEWQNHNCIITWFFVVKRNVDPPTPTPSSRPPDPPRSPTPNPSITPTSSVTPGTPTPSGTPTPGTPTPGPTTPVPEDTLPPTTGVPIEGPSSTPTDGGPGTITPPGPTISPEIIPSKKPPIVPPPTGDNARTLFYIIGGLISITALVFILLAMKVRRDGALFKRK